MERKFHFHELIISLTLFLLTISSYCQNSNDSLDKKKFWNECVKPIINKDKVKLKQIVHFPLAGEWGYMIELNKPKLEWTEVDFYNNLDRLFFQTFLDSIVKRGYDHVEEFKHPDGTDEILISAGFVEVIDGIKVESAIILRFKKFNKKWKLYVFQSVG